MDLSLPATRSAMPLPKRWLVFGAAIALGASAGSGWPLAASAWAYEGLLGLFVSPGFEITSLAMAIGMGFLLGLVHVTAI
jgi:hypothetical protein